MSLKPTLPKAFVITIDIPASHSAADRCIKSASKFGLYPAKFPGRMPKHNPVMQAKTLGLPLENFQEKYSRFENCLSAFLSHHKLWTLSAELGEDLIIFEHDAVVRDHIPDVPFKGVLSYGAPSYGKFKTPPNIGVNKLVSKQYLPGAHAYKVSPSAAQQLIDTAPKSACPTDLYIRNELFPFVEEYYPWPVEAIDSFSTIQRTEGCLAKHNYDENYELL